MAGETKLLATINATALQNGHVTLKLSGSGKDLAVDLAPDELSGLVRVILSAAHGASFFSGKKPILKTSTIAELVPTTFIGLESLPAQGHRAILIQTGESVVTYSVTTNGLRELSLAMKAASRDHQSPGLSLGLRTRVVAHLSHAAVRIAAAAKHIPLRASQSGTRPKPHGRIAAERRRAVARPDLHNAEGASPKRAPRG